MHLISCTNTHRDITDSVNHGTVKNTKNLNLCFGWHILRSYRFVAEVTFKFVKKTSMPHLSKPSDISSATAQVDPDLLKALAILSDTTVRRSTVDQEDLKPNWKSEKRPHFCRWSTILLFTSFSKTLLTTERRLTGR